MTCLNDITEEIIRNDYIIDLLLLLGDDDQVSFYGFYIRYINFSLKFYKLENKVDKNFQKLMSIMYRISWLPNYFKRFTNAIDRLDSNNFEKLINHLCNYLTECNPYTNQPDIENKKSLYRLHAKVMLIDNINLI
jgi:hypothetical protein